MKSLLDFHVRLEKLSWLKKVRCKVSKETRSLNSEPDVQTPDQAGAQKPKYLCSTKVLGERWKETILEPLTGSTIIILLHTLMWGILEPVTNSQKLHRMQT